MASKLTLSQRAKKDPKLLARALKDPGLRSKLDASLLSPEQRKQREANTFRRDLNDITTPLSGDSMDRVARTLADREISGRLRSIEGDEKLVTGRRDEQRRRADTYYDTLARIGSSTAGGQQTANASTMDALRSIGSQAQGAIGQAKAGVDQRAAGDAATRGSDLSGGSMEALASQVAGAQARAAESNAASSQFAAQQGAAQSALLGSLQLANAQTGAADKGTIERRGSEALEALARERASVREDADGRYTDTLLKLRGGEVDRYITERGLADKAEQARMDFDLAVREMESKEDIAAEGRRLEATLKREGWDAQDARAEADRASREAIANADRKQSDTNNRRNNADKGEGGFTSKERRDNAGKRDDAFAIARQAKDGKEPREVVLRNLTREFGDAIAKAAVGAFYDGGVAGHTATNLKKKKGIDVPSKYLRRRR